MAPSLRTIGVLPPQAMRLDDAASRMTLPTHPEESAECDLSQPVDTSTFKLKALLKDELLLFAHGAMRDTIFAALEEVNLRNTTTGNTPHVRFGSSGFRSERGRISSTASEDRFHFKSYAAKVERKRTEDLLQDNDEQHPFESSYSALNKSSTMVKTDTDNALRTKKYKRMGSGFLPPATACQTRDSSTPATSHLSAECFRRWLRSWIASDTFALMITTLVLLNCVVLGLEVNCQAQQHQVPMILDMSSPFFCTAFALELFARCYVHRMDFFYSKERYWNVFDTALVFFQVIDEAASSMLDASASQMSSRLSATMRTIRLLRLVRIVRALRLLRLSCELKALGRSVYASISSVSWAWVFIFMINYVCSVFILQIIICTGHLPLKGPMRQWFGSLPRTILTMFECIFGGASWNDVVMPLVTDIHPLMSVLILFYVVLCLMAVMNIATGLIVDTVRKGMDEDNDRDLARSIQNVFLAELQRNERITRQVFVQKIEESEVMKDFLWTIDVDPDNASLLFELIDIERQDNLSVEDVVEGCLRVRGPGRALEMQVMTRELEWLRRAMAEEYCVRNHGLDS